MALALRALAEVLEKRFDVREIGGLHGESINGAQAMGFSLKENQSAFGAAQISGEDHEE
jgi:hypothetical protein